MVSEEEKTAGKMLEKHGEEADIAELKMKKSRCKAAYTRARNRLSHELDDEMDSEAAKELLDQVEEKMDAAVEAIQNICVFYKEKKRTKEMVETLSELDIAEKQYEDTLRFYQETLNLSSSGSDAGKKSDKGTVQLGNDLWKQLRRVSISVFHGDKIKYPAWRAAFYSCVDEAPSTPEYKLLQLRQYLGGEALKSIENLGHSAEAYTAAKVRLERKYGGTKRIVNRFLDELESFSPLRSENPRELEKFADLLDVAVINLKEVSHEEDLKDGALYHRLLKKLPQSMLTRYNRYIDEKELVESVEGLREWVNLETDYAMRANETIYGLEKLKVKTFFGKNVQKDKKVQKDGIKDYEKCKICGKGHKVWSCELFKNMSVEDRWAKAKEQMLCFRCLKANHLGNKCKFQGKCGINGCDKTHNRLLHKENPAMNIHAKEYQPVKTSQVFSASNTNCIALRTIPVILKVKDREIRLNALLDDGSTKSYLNEEVASELGITGERNLVEVNVLNGKSETFETTSVNFTIMSDNRNIVMKMEAQTIRNVTGKLRPIDWTQNQQKWPHLQGICFPKLSRRSKVDLLIGLDYVELHRSLGEIQGEKGDPVARLTPLGWTCVGPINSDEEASFFTFHSNDTQKLDENVQKFWETENEGVKDYSKISPRDQEIMTKAEKSIQFTDNHYEVELPWKRNPEELPDNYEMARKRLESTERRLKKDPVVKEMYTNTIEGYVEKGYVKKVEKKELPGNKWLLPHFPVIRMGKETTKVRIVFDASARFQGTCLNDVLDQGPKLQNSLFDVLMRFRKNKVALACDIQEMYMRVGIIPTDRRFNRFLWRPSEDEKPAEYEFTRLVFGVSSSPFLAQLVSRHNAQKYQDKYPRAAETVIYSTYMDDSMDSVDTSDEAIALYKDLDSLWQKAGMFAHKWISNSKEVLQSIPAQDRALKVDLTKDELPKMKTLGVLWEAENDHFTYQFNPVVVDDKLTKREYLRTIATLFDPLGLLAPYVIRAKMMMQDIWLSGIDWDENIQADSLRKIIKWLDELPKVEQIKVPRCLKENRETQVTIHSFGDASVRAYGAVVYVRNEHPSGEVFTRIVAAKSRVAPMETISIPRLELMAAVLSLELTLTVKDALEIDMNECTFWTDSIDVVCWLRNQSRVFKPFIANRVAEIQRNSKPSQWRHLPGEQNPADLVSRGESVEKLIEESLWWEGPEFLKSCESVWPKTPVQGKKLDKKEVKKSEMEQFQKVNDNYNLPVDNRNYVSYREMEKSEDLGRLDPLRYSSWEKLKRVTAWVLRFLENGGKTKEFRQFGELTIEELRESEEMLIREDQKKELCEYNEIVKGKTLQKNSKLLPLNPVIDTEGILRSNSRLQYAEFISFDSRFPIILPRNSWLTKLIVRSAHERCNHAGTNQVLSKLSTRYWIIHAREVIREVENDCCVCKRQKTKPMSQIMAPLPSSRLGVPMKAFANVAVDYGGPFLTIQGRGKSRQKRYLCLFTCLAVRAVHLEMAYGLDTSSFLNAFFRFVSRRGLPIKVYSDNGTNFVGADKEMKALVKELDKQQIQRSAADKGIDWQFNPPLAPHWGGAHEIMIKAAKRAVYAILHGADVTDEELSTAFVGAESLINSRPLTYQSANPADCTPVTPNHFLFGQVGGEFAPQTVDSMRFHPLNRWRRVQELMKHFWQRWQREWLPNLTARKKWFNDQRDLAEGDVVLVVSPDNPRGQWPLGRVVRVHQGVDGHVRSATVLIRGKDVERPITKLCPLECAN